MATSYTAKFSSACGPNAPCIFDSDPSQKTGAVCTGIGLPAFRPVTDGTAIPGTKYLGGAAQQVLAETSGDPNLP
jgi:hypothetical protein